MKKYGYHVVLAVAAAVIITGTLAFSTFGGSATLAYSHEASFKACHVTNADGTEAQVVSSGRSVGLVNGTLLTLISSDMHQGYIAVRASVGGKMLRLAIIADDTDCLN